MLNYFLVGGTASITFITILSRYRESGEQREADRAMSAILTAMLVVLGTATLLAELFAPLYVRFFLKGFAPAQAALCVEMTRILLPAQICFFAGGVFGAVLLVNRQFGYQAVTPLIYNLGIIAGGVFLAHRLGISSLAVGALVGALLGALALNAFGAHRAGMRFKPVWDLKHPGLREWVRLSIPLMIGASLVTFDTYILNYFASHGHGDITRLAYAKRLFSAPMAIVGQAAGAASLPFFASLLARNHREEFARSVNNGVTRLVALSLLLSAWMIVLAGPAVDLVFHRGRFNAADAQLTALYFTLFAGSLCFWSAQALYARAFYAAGNMKTPMIGSTIVTVLSLPVYSLLFREFGVPGLAIASDLGIAANTIVLAVLLSRARLARLSGVHWGEVARALAAAVAAGALAKAAVWLLARWLVGLPAMAADLLFITLGTLLWFAIGWLVLRVTGSSLPQEIALRLRRRKSESASPPPAIA